jgi:hypothetical protein
LHTSESRKTYDIYKPLNVNFMFMIYPPNACLERSCSLRRAQKRR